MFSTLLQLSYIPVVAAGENGAGELLLGVPLLQVDSLWNPSFQHAQRKKSFNYPWSGLVKCYLKVASERKSMEETKWPAIQAMDTLWSVP